MSEDSPARHHVQLSSDHASVERAVEETRAFVSQHLSDDELSYRTVLVVSEAVTNAAEHGNKYDQEKKVNLELVWNQPEMTIVVEDEGAGFNPDEVQDPLSPDNLTRERGRGLFLIYQMSEDVQYEKEGTRLQVLLRPKESDL